MTAFEHSDAIERAVRRLTARLTTLRGFCDAATSANDASHPRRHDSWRGLCDAALTDCHALEILWLKPPRSSIDYSNVSLNLKLIQTLADVIATRSDDVKQALLQLLEKTRQETADNGSVKATRER